MNKLPIIPLLKNTPVSLSKWKELTALPAVSGGLVLIYIYVIVEMSGNQMISRFTHGFKTVNPNQGNW